MAEHPYERRASPDGRRNGDAWLTRAVKIAALLGACAAPLLAFNARVADLERTKPTELFMLCGLYRKAYPEAVPPICANAITPLPDRR